MTDRSGPLTYAFVEEATARVVAGHRVRLGALRAHHRPSSCEQSEPVGARLNGYRKPIMVVGMSRMRRSETAASARVSRRSLLIAAGLVNLGFPLAAGCSSTDDGTDSAGQWIPNPSASTLHTGWRSKPDGPLPPVGDEGITIVNTRSHVEAAPSLHSGALVGNLPSQQSASYVNQDMGAKVQRIGAVFSLGPGNAAGALCLAAWARVLPSAGGQLIETHCHFVITPELWIFGVVVSNQLIELAHGGFSSPLPQDGSPRLTEVRFRGPTATILLPDKSVQMVSDDRIDTLFGTIACWEFYKNASGAANVRFYETWAS